MKVASMDQSLLDFLDHSSPFDAIIVEGYDGVGKGRVLNLLSEHYDVVPYRPDYNFWQQYDHRKTDRWKVSGFFWDVFSHFNIHPSKPMLFDRGVISGAVYNDDISIAQNYKNLLRGMNVLHIFVYCLKEDYEKFQESRNSQVKDNWEDCIEYNKRYKEALETAGVQYVLFRNAYDPAKSKSAVCEGCGHYSYGWCTHPVLNFRVTGSNPRCSYSEDKEVQDSNVDEVHCV